MEDKAFIAVLTDIIDYKKREVRVLFTMFVIMVLLNFATIVAFLYYEANMETTTTTTTTQTVDGEDNDIVNGDQYNDESQNRSTP